MRTRNQTSTAALMVLVVLAALELALFQQVWFLFLTAHSLATEFILLDVLGVAAICCGGWAQHRLHDPAATNADQPPPLDGRAARPL